MNITDEIIELLPTPYKEEVQNNKEIQFYIHNEGYCFKDVRFKATMYEHDNFEYSIKDIIKNFKDHVNSI